MQASTQEYIMPNWCGNVLTIRAPKETLDIIESGAKEGRLLQTLAPLPPHKQEEWYDTQVATWGVKWEISPQGTLIDRHDDFITLNFDSAWTPPISALETAVQRLNITELEMIYLEGGCAFCGVAEYNTCAGFWNNTYDTPMSIEDRENIKKQEPALAEWLDERYDDDFLSGGDDDA